MNDRDLTKMPDFAPIQPYVSHPDGDVSRYLPSNIDELEAARREHLGFEPGDRNEMFIRHMGKITEAGYEGFSVDIND